MIFVLEFKNKLMSIKISNEIMLTLHCTGEQKHHFDKFIYLLFTWVLYIVYLPREKHLIYCRPKEGTFHQCSP